MTICATCWPARRRSGSPASATAITASPRPDGGEMVRRSTGRRLGAFFRDEVAGPLGIDLHIGAPEAVSARTTPVIGAVPDPAAPPRASSPRRWPTAKALPRSSSSTSPPSTLTAARRTPPRSARPTVSPTDAARRPLRAARQWRALNGVRPVGAGHAHPHELRLGRHPRGRDAGDPDALLAWIHEVDGQPRARQRRRLLGGDVGGRLRPCRGGRLDWFSPTPRRG